MSSRFTFNATDAHIIELSKYRQIAFPKNYRKPVQIGIDIGGSLAKVVWYSQNTNSYAATGGRLNFTKFETENIDKCIEFLKEIIKKDNETINLPHRVLKATGGGAHKFNKLLNEELNVIVETEDEMECLITGLNFLVHKIPYEVFTYSESEAEPMVFEEKVIDEEELYPYILVNIGSGVSIIKVTEDGKLERIGGSSLGGGTLWGLLSLLTSAQTFDEMLELSKKGKNENVDMLVGDIYGEDYSKIGLKSSTIASSCGKIFKKKPEERKEFKEEDISRSLLYMISNNLSQIAYLMAQLHQVKRIYFGGCFIRGHPVIMNSLSFGIRFWSKGTIKALFLRHEGYLGALGAFLKHHGNIQEQELLGFSENFTKAERINTTAINAVGLIDIVPKLTYFPLILSDEYHPDTFDLSDPELQKYWIDTFDKNLHKMVDMALSWLHTHFLTNTDNSKSFEDIYRKHLQVLRREPNAYGPLSVRSLLILREQCLHEMGFGDIFEHVKQEEKRTALETLPNLLKKIDALPENEKLSVLIDNVLAGNMFDWGANEVHNMLQKGELNFDSAKIKVKKSEKYFNLNEFRESLELNQYHKAVIFVDNSGADIVLGIIPFARYLLSHNIDVILAANSLPCVNDVTYNDLISIIEQVTSFDKPINDAYNIYGKLMVYETGSGSPCLDLRNVSCDLAEACENVDLVIIEGMGRAMHTNFHAKFICDSLKLAVFKNASVAKTLGGNMYDGICLFEKGEKIIGIAKSKRSNTFNEILEAGRFSFSC
ncbi:fumble-domain-containing protein [Anaeromyces robustus]|uniref:pantothenate kinase n=1 Tax=Anaeromyces robustus TaxID=1754192 RepID=A0A1Y1X8P2_9FUNG|nr:fumble-domain-containing protein [Anaeromyces robustus]|eukprot:ORX82130.1 fumble-domain-containing protein [Anaeromyces robustus]